MRILITAGPTREYIDTVRFISNASSGRMGYAIASSASRKKHNVILISGPVNLRKPKCEKFIEVTSAREMKQAVFDNFENADVIIMSAAVSDYRPASKLRHKLKKDDKEISLKLVRNPDILAELGRRKEKRILIGFALEDRNAKANALRKFRSKNLDAIILNSPAAIDSETDKVQIYTEQFGWQEFPEMSKKRLASVIINLAQKLVDLRK